MPVYVPPEGVYFQLTSAVTKRRLFSRRHLTPHVGTYDGPDYPDQWFTVIKGERYGDTYKYALKTKDTDCMLFCRGHDKHIGNIEGRGNHQDMYVLACQNYSPNINNYNAAGLFSKRMQIDLRDNSVYYARPILWFSFLGRRIIPILDAIRHWKTSTINTSQ